MRVELVLLIDSAIAYNEVTNTSDLLESYSAAELFIWL